MNTDNRPTDQPIAQDDVAFHAMHAA